MIRVVEGSVLKAPVIAHQVNCRGAFGAGLAGQIAERWPACKKSYLSYVQSKDPGELFGTVYVWEGLDVVILNLFGQDQPGPHTSEIALLGAAQRIPDFMEEEGIGVVAMPWMIGCGIGGGDWSRIQPMIEKVFQGPRLHLEWYRL
jgi:O-acetyl-ADP-ribose deacetylase (regulator of RNase III)